MTKEGQEVPPLQKLGIKNASKNLDLAVEKEDT